MTEFSIYDELMPKVQALISPPDTGTKEKSSSDIHSFLKKRGKRHNHDYCDACGEKGNILCCDICPASFHLLCHDPPLVGNNIILNQWRCRACSNTPDGRQELDENYESSSSSDRNIRKLDCSIKNTTSISSDTSGKEDGNAPSGSNSARVEINQSSATDDEVRIKEESMEEEIDIPFRISVDPSDADRLQNDDFLPLKINVEPVEIKTEPRSTDGPDKDKTHSKEAENDSETDVGKSRKRYNVTKDGHEMLAKRMKYIDLSINLPKCDNLVNHLHGSRSSVAELSDDSETRPSPTKSLGRSRRGARSEPCKTNIKSIKDVFSEVIKKAKKMNPKQFTLPIEYLTNINLNVIGSEKGPESIFNDMDSNDLIKIPPRRCYYCNGICLIGEIVSCDYCPAHFHLNCLNPPLCSIPDVKWMCPLHPHHILNKVMKNPSSITELTSWWSKLSVPVDDEAVKSEFLDKIKEMKKNKEDKTIFTRPSCKIPDMVKYHYKFPKSRIPSLRELIDSDYGCVFGQNFMLTTHELVSRSNNCCDCYKGPEVTRDWENQTVDFSSPPKEPSSDRVIPCFSEDTNSAVINVAAVDTDYDQKQLDPQRSKKSEGGGVLIEITNDDSTSTSKPGDPVNENKQQHVNEALSNWDDQTKSFKFTSCGIYDYDSLIKAQPKKRNGSSMSELIVSSPSCLAEVQTQEKSRVNDEKSRVNDVPPPETEPESVNINVTPWQMIKHLVLRGIDQTFVTGGLMQTKLDHALKQGLLAEKLRLITRDLPPSFLPNTQPYPFFPPSNKNGHQLLVEKPKSRVRAVLCPLSHRAPLVYMYGHVLSVGSGFSNDVCLLNYGDCNFVSDEHAVIFYDEFTNMYELLNYSEYSTVVDGICYTCDLSSRNVSLENDLNFMNSSESEEKSVDDRPPLPRPPERKSVSATVAADTAGLRRGGSAVVAAETRNIHKKLLNDIDKLVTKSQEEMAFIAEEDLNEISRAVKLNTEVVGHQRECSPVQTQTPSPKKLQPVIVVRRKKMQKRSMAPSAACGDMMVKGLLRTPDRHMGGRVNRSLLNSKSTQSRSQLKGSVNSNQMDCLAVQRRKRRRKRSIVSSLRRERVVRRKTAAKQKISDECRESVVESQSAANSTEVQFNNVEYESTSNFRAARNKEQCRCQLANLKLPVGYDSSWEKPASLHHGSYIRFGCVEFVFSIVNYPVSYENRLYGRSSISPALSAKPEISVRPPSSAPAPKAAPPKKPPVANISKDDLSTRLISILNVLSSKPSPAESSSKSASSSEDDESSDSSSMSSGPSSSDSSIGNEELTNGRFEIDNQPSNDLHG